MKSNEYINAFKLCTDSNTKREKRIDKLKRYYESKKIKKSQLL